MNTHGYPFKPDIFQPVGPPNLCAYPSVSGITGKPESSTQVPKRQQRKVWTIQETQVLWECYEKAYSLGQLTSKTSKVNSSGWEVVLKDFNKALNSCSMPPCSLQQIKEKVNNMKSEHKNIKDRESQTGEGTQQKPRRRRWFLLRLPEDPNHSHATNIDSRRPALDFLFVLANLSTGIRVSRYSSCGICSAIIMVAVSIAIACILRRLAI